MSDTPVLLSIDGPVATLTLNRPSVFNAFDRAFLRTLEEHLVAVGRDPAVRVVVITGAGAAFCAGGDLKAVVSEHPDQPGQSFHALAPVFHQCILEIRGMAKPVVAGVNGPAAGGGFSLALACDYRLASDAAFLQQAYTSSGLTIDGGGTYSLVRLVGLARALELALLDERLPAARAEALGLVNRVVPAAEFPEALQTLAGSLASRAVGAFGRVKRLLNVAADTSLEAQLEAERRNLADAADAPEGREGLAAFNEKRKPDFPGAGL